MKRLRINTTIILTDTQHEILERNKYEFRALLRKNKATYDRELKSNIVWILEELEREGK